MEAGAVSVRLHHGGPQGAKPKGEVVADILSSIKDAKGVKPMKMDEHRTFAPPGITVQPTNLLVGLGSNATFTVTATNATGYTWRKAGSTIGGANADSFTLTSVTSGDAANYSVIAGNLGGSVTSSVASLTLIISVNTNPTNIIASVSGTNLNLSWPADRIGWGLLPTESLPGTFSGSFHEFFITGSSDLRDSESARSQRRRARRECRRGAARF